MLLALPDELSVHLSRYLALPDASALARTCRATPVAAAEVLAGERRTRACLVADPDAADLLRRVGVGGLCRAWGLDATRPYAELYAHVLRRLDPDAYFDDYDPYGLPFALATCDAPGSVTLVYDARRRDRRALMCALAGVVAQGTTGRRPVAIGLGAELLRAHLDAALPATAAGGADPSLMLVEYSAKRHYDATSWHVLVGALTDHRRRGGAVVLHRKRYDPRLWAELKSGFTREVRTIVIPSGPDDVRSVFPHLLYSRCFAPPLGMHESRDLWWSIASLAPHQWLVVDVWRRRWYRWSIRPP